MLHTTSIDIPAPKRMPAQWVMPELMTDARIEAASFSKEQKLLISALVGPCQRA
jgi:hypothetical protein